MLNKPVYPDKNLTIFLTLTANSCFLNKELITKTIKLLLDILAINISDMSTIR